ncbi:sigma-70 family RNA polymerase sigma factor [Enterococcus sp. HY326]|uniref:sigma-70 family RNA polymerase sigma factor n=1 Tax=Enterococcus sp. HY326 TaxID=2971265 RepID=UPI00223EAA1F|nr:sigma-70 family RNA polymerase sigma factor [Enterococcus sp. HY326]
MSDEEIINGLLQEDYAALDQLIDRYGRLILWSIHNILNQPEEFFYQKEAENETFFKIWQNIAAYNPEKSQFSTWLVQISKHVALDIKRKLVRLRKVEPVLSIEDSALLYDEGAPFLKENFLDLIACLNTEDQLIFLQRYYYQEAPTDIAASLDLSIETIYNRLSRGRKRLKEVLQNEANLS